MATAALFVIPHYSGSIWEPLPNLEVGAQELARLLGKHKVTVGALACATTTGVTQQLADSVSPSGDPLLVYIGGHGIVHARRHYTALDATVPKAPNSTNALWSTTVAEILAGRERDVLVVLDSCFAGEGAVELLTEAASALADLRDGKSFGVLASCRAFEPAEDGIFVETLLTLMCEGPRYDVNAWGPGDERIRTGALAEELRRSGLYVSGNLEAAELRLLPNPCWNAAEPEGRVDVKAALRRLTRDAEDHLLEKSAGFVGRTNARRAVARWLADGPTGIFVVTGGPGTGKSALMGVLARQSVKDPVALALDHAIAPDSFDVIIHARQKTLDAVRSELEPALGGPTGCTVLVDALDEAVAGEALGIAAHLASLARREQAAILVGARPDPALGRGGPHDDTLLRELRADAVHRLDDPADPTTRADIAAMVRAELLAAVDSPYRAAGVPVDEIAEASAELTSPSFLFAHATARWLSSRARAISEQSGWRETLRRSAGEAGLGRIVDEDLAARYPDRLARVHDLLRAVAWTEGLGLPRYTIWPAFANELATSAHEYTDPDVTWLLNDAGWYLTEATEDGQTVYRPFHRALIDHLRTATPGGASTAHARLVERLRRIATDAGGWARADPYVLHYLIAHAEQAGAPGYATELLSDPEFVAHANPDRLARVVRRFRDQLAGPVTRAAHLLDTVPQPQRAALLELTSLQEQLPRQQPYPAPGTPWWPLWAQWQPSAPHVTLAGHHSGVNAVAFAPDGHTLASVDSNGTVRLWDARNGEHQRSLRGHGYGVTAVAFSPDGETVASAGNDRTIRLWDRRSGRCQDTLAGHQDWIRSVAFSPDGGRLASAGDDRTVRLWDARDGVLQRTLEHDRAVRAVAFSADGRTLASAGDDRSVHLWDGRDGAHRRTLIGHEHGVASVAFSPDGETLASASDDQTMRLWDARSGACRCTLIGHGYVNSIAFSPDGSLLASAGNDRTVRLWDARKGRQQRILSGHDYSVNAVAFSPDGATLASAALDSTVRLWDTRDTGQQRAFIGHEGWVRSVAFSPDGRLLASAGDDWTVRLWDAHDGAHRYTLTGHDHGVRSVVFSPDGGQIASGGNDGAVRLWDARTGGHRRTLPGHEDGVAGVAFSPDGRLIASASDDRTVSLWDARTGVHQRTLAGHDDRVTSVAFSPDGSALASASDDGTVLLWSPRKGRPQRELAAHRRLVNAVAFSPDGETLASAGDDRTVMLWDARSGAHVRTLEGHTQPVNGVGFSLDGALVASAGNDGIVRLWHTRDGERAGLVPARSTCNGLSWSRNAELAIAANGGVAVIDVLS